MELNIKGIMSYPVLITPKQVNGQGDPKYQVNIMIAKTDAAQLTLINDAINAMVVSGHGGTRPKDEKICLKDCAKEWPNQPELHGYMELRTNTAQTNKPHVVHESNIGIPLTDVSKVFPGAVAVFNVNIAAYDNVSKGVGAYINGVCILDEEGALGRLDNKKSSTAMFGGVVGAGAGTQTQPPVTAPNAAGTADAPPPPGAAGTAEAPPPPGAPVHQMTATATTTYEKYIEGGWTDELLIQHKHMLPPGGVETSY